MRLPHAAPADRKAVQPTPPDRRSVGRMTVRAWVLAAILAMCLSSVAGAQNGGGFGPAPIPGGEITRTGWLSVVWGEAQPGPGSPTMILLLTDDAGETTPILLDEATARPLGGLIGLDRGRGGGGGAVRGRGAAARGGAPPPLQVQSVQLDLSARPLSGPSALEAAAVAGPQPWINILCKFSDASTEPKPLSSFDGLIGG